GPHGGKLIMRRSTRILVFTIMSVLAGCTTHYREALVEYRAGEPIPFYQRTIDWVAEAPQSASSSELPAEPVIESADSAQVPADRAHEIAAKVLGVPLEWYVTRVMGLADNGSVEQTLKDELR